MAIEPRASHAGLPVDREQDRREGERQAEQGGQVLAQDHHQLALPALAEPLPQAAAALHLGDFVQAGAQRDGLGGQPEHQDADRHPGIAEALGLVQLVPAFVEREQAAEREQHQRDDERPEEHRLAPAQGVVGGGRAFGLLQAPQQEHLVAAVGIGVDRLGQHRARAGEDRRGGLGGGDRQVRAQRIQDRADGIGFHGLILFQ